MEWRIVCRLHGFFGGFTLMNSEKIERDENRITGFTSSAFLLILFLYVSNNTTPFDLTEALSGQQFHFKKSEREISVDINDQASWWSPIACIKIAILIELICIHEDRYVR